MPVEYAELEQSIKAVAQYVKDEINRMDSKLEMSTTPKKEISEYMKQINDMRNDIKNEFNKIKIVKSELEKISKEKEEILEKLGQIDGAVSECDTIYTRMGTVEEKTSMDLEQAKSVKASVDSKLEHFDSKIKTDIEKIQSLKDNIEMKIESLDIKASRLDDVEKRISDQIKRSPEFQKVVDAESVLDKKLSHLMNSIDGKIIENVKSIAEPMINHNLQESLDKIKAVAKDMEKLKGDLDSESIQRISMEKSHTDLAAKVGSIDRKISKITDMAESELNSIRSEVDNKLLVEENEITKIREKLEKNMAKRTEEFVKELDEIKLKMNEEVNQISKLMNKNEINALKTKVECLDKKLSGDENELNKARDMLQKNMEKKSEEFIHDINSMKMQLEKEITKLNESNEIAKINKRIDETSIRLENAFKKISQNRDKSELEKKIENIERLEASFEDKFKHIYDARKDIDSWSARLDSTDKHLSDINEKMKKMGHLAETVKDLELFDSKKLEMELENNRRVISNMEKNTEMRATNLITKHLDEFARQMDRKLPDITTKEDYNKLVSALSSKFKSIESPDLTHLERKVDYLERRLEEAIKIMKNFSSRVPMIVE